MKPDHSLTVEFVTERFDYRGEIPEEANAGNRFYGRDIAEFLCSELAKHDVAADFLDEDWGWLVLGRHKSQEPVELAIYHWGGAEPNGTGVSTGTWRVRANSWIEKPLLLLFKRRSQSQCSLEFASKLRAVLESAGCNITVFGHSNDW